MKLLATFEIKEIKRSPEYGHLRFKKLQEEEINYSSLYSDEIRIDVVDLETFIKKEENRIPIFFSTSLRLQPKPDKIPNFLSEEKTVAILGVSLSGKVTGLSIYKIRAGSKDLELMKPSFFNYPHILSPVEKTNDDFENAWGLSKKGDNIESILTLVLLIGMYALFSYGANYGISKVNFSLDAIHVILGIFFAALFFGISQTFIFVFFIRLHKVSLLLLCILLIISIFNLPYIFYSVLRCFVFMIGLSGIIGVAMSIKSNKQPVITLSKVLLLMFMSTVIVLFNPFASFHFTKDEWIIIDIIAAFIFLPLFFFKKLDSPNY